jgi:hypothetical protein
MATCGLRTQGKWRGGNRCTGWPRLSPYHGFVQWAVSCIACVTFAAFLAGCATSVKYGSPPKVNQLSLLEQGMSVKSDVRAAFGEPRGYGAGRFHLLPTPREIWFYEYMETDGVRTQLKFLLVFFEADRYDGHLWFSSSSLMDVVQ